MPTKTIGLPHSRGCQHMMALPAERCKIEYGDRPAIPSEPPSLAGLSAALASDGGGEGWPIPLVALVGLSIVRRLRNLKPAAVLCDHGALRGGTAARTPCSKRDCIRKRNFSPDHHSASDLGRIKRAGLTLVPQ